MICAEKAQQQKQKMINIITKVGSIFAKKVVQPTNAQKALKIAQTVAIAARPFAVDAVKIAAGLCSGWAGYKLAVATICTVENVQEKIAPAAKATVDAVAMAAGNTAAAAVGFATGFAHKATGIFSAKSKAKAKSDKSLSFVEEDVI